MRSTLFCASLCLLLIPACNLTPSPEEKAVRDSYNGIVDQFEQGDYSAAFDHLSGNTRSFLDDLAEALDYYGMPMGADGRELFAGMLSEADMTDLSTDIRSITVEGTTATVVTITAEGDETLRFVLEDGSWNLDFEQLIRDGMDEGLQGSGFTTQDLLDHEISVESGSQSVMSATYGDGPCPIWITNGLGSSEIWYAYVSPSSETEWGDDALGSSMLAVGGVLTVGVESGTYDILVEDEDGHTYSRYGIEVDQEGYSWEVAQADEDPSE